MKTNNLLDECDRLIAEHAELVQKVMDAANELNAANLAYVEKIDAILTSSK